MPIKRDPAYVDEIARRYVSGEPSTKIAASLHVCPNTVKKLLAERGIKVRRGAKKPGGFIRPRTWDDATAVRLYASGMQVDQVAAELGSNRNLVSRVIRANGVTIRRDYPGRPRLAIDEADAVLRFQAGETAEAIAAVLGCSRGKVTKVLQEHGVVTDRAARAAARLAEGNIKARYLSGESALSIARGLGIPPGPVSEALRAQGVTIRGPRRNPAAPAAPKVYGPPGGSRFAQACLSAKTREARAVVSADESEFAGMLTDRGVEIVHQKAVGPYNVDLAAGSVAVEIYGPRHRGERQRERLSYILDNGYDVIFVTGNREHDPFRAEAAEYVIAHLEFRSGNPSAGRCYRVIRGDGQLIAAGSAQDDDIPDVVPFVRAAKYLPGEAPEGTCECGCGDPIGPGLRFLHGHSNARRQYAGGTD